MKLRINYLAILACLVMHGLLGVLWYNGIFASTWMTLNGISPGAQMADGTLPYVYSGFMSLMMALLLAWLSGKLRIGTVINGARLGFMIAFSTFLVGFATSYRFSGRPMQLALIDALYPVISMTLMGAIIGGWRTRAQKIASMQMQRA